MHRTLLPAALALLLPAAAPGAAQVAPWPLPVASASQPNLAAQGDALLLSWIERDGEAHVLRYARHADGAFAAPRTIARGTDWFVNWADFPAMVALPDGRMAAHFLQKSAKAPYAYDVRLVQSADGIAWSEPVTVHDDGTRTEHGFVALWPWSGERIALAWLDGRHTAGGDGAHGGGTMTLRAAVFDAEGKRDEWELDRSACDCCQTDVALAEGGPVLVYRDRTEDEIRDVAVTRWRDGRWTAPVRVHADEWKMPACPVNGPAIAAQGREVHVGWYTAAGGTPELRLARSDDDGASFGAPLSVARGTHVQGRVDLLRAQEALYVSWLEEDARGQRLWLARYPAGLRGTPETVEVATLARGRGTGFPRLAWHAGAVHVVFTDVVEGRPQLRGARVRFDGPPAVATTAP